MSSAGQALKQIKEKKYYEPYLSDERKIFCIGIAFDKKERNIKEYKIKTIDELWFLLGKRSKGFLLGKRSKGFLWYTQTKLVQA